MLESVMPTEEIGASAIGLYTLRSGWAHLTLWSERDRKPLTLRRGV